MSQMNLFLSLNAYEDENPTNHPSKSVVKWVTDLQGIEITEPKTQVIKLPAGQAKTLFSSEVTISDDNTTTYDLALKSGSTNLYILKHNDGTAPVFRTARSTGADATTQVTVTKNGTVLTFTSTGGTALNLVSGGVVAGDEVRIQNIFNTANRGKFKILSVTATSFSVENEAGAAEGPITLGAGFADDLQIYSQAGVQIGQKVKISSGFSPVSWGVYEISDVGPDFLQFYIEKALPSETDIESNIRIFDNSKQFLFIESSKRISLEIDGVDNGVVTPILAGTKLKPGIYLRNSEMYSAVITNDGTDEATVTVVIAE